jgi:hypothetical protein
MTKISEDIALSIRQPWAWLIVNGFKDVENRDWKTDFRGRFLVHAAYKFDYDGYAYVKKNFKVKLPEINEFQRGGIIGSVEIHDCVTESDSQWFEGKYGFLLRKPRPMPFVELKGKLKFFKVKL